MNSIIFQAMDDDYVHSFPLDDLLNKLRQIESESRPSEEAYFFNIHLNRVASGVPYAFVTHNKSCGFFLSVSEGTTSPMRQAYVVKVSHDVSPVRVSAAEHRLILPTGVFLSTEAVVACVAHFCETGSRHPAFTWIPFEDSWYEE